MSKYIETRWRKKMRFHRHAWCHAPFERVGGSEGFRPRRRFGREQAQGGRMFEPGDLRFVILKLISEKPSHGYEIIKAIEDRLGGAYAPSPGIVYPTLALLEDLGYLAVVDSAGSRKLYSVTDEGRAALQENRVIIDAIFQRMAEVNARYGGGPPPKILRAYENLKTALRLRVGGAPLSETQIGKIADLLDQAAKAVEAI
jgi:DNA-binding PadR family transcriptional regulator